MQKDPKDITFEEWLSERIDDFDPSTISEADWISEQYNAWIDADEGRKRMREQELKFWEEMQEEERKMNEFCAREYSYEKVFAKELEAEMQAFYAEEERKRKIALEVIEKLELPDELITDLRWIDRLSAFNVLK